MPIVLDAALTGQLARLAPSGVQAGARLIQPGDEDWLSQGEGARLTSAITAVRRASGAARDVVRVLARADIEVLNGANGDPIWPPDLIGAISHDESVAAAVVGRRRDFGGLGVDVEPNQPLEADLPARIATPAELAEMPGRDVTAHEMFSVKEAVFKAVFPSDRLMLDFLDVSVDLVAGTATTRYGRKVRWRSSRSAKIFAVAWW